MCNQARFSARQRTAWFCAFILFATAFPARSEELGRLFFTPEHREALDRQRESGGEEIVAEQEDEEEKEDAPVALAIDGVVTRSSGKRTVWVNGIAQEDAQAGRGITVVPNRARPGEVTISPGDRPQIRASVGETVIRTTGETVSPLGGGLIEIRPATR